MKAYIELDCRRCGNCSGDECLKYGADADAAVALCVQEAFSNYVEKQHEEAPGSISN